MSSIYNLFIVRSPLQLINAIEAKHYFSTQNNILCLIHNQSTINSTQMYQLLKFDSWNETIELNRGNQKNSFLKNIQLIKRLSKKQYQYIFTGHLGNINIALISSLKKEKVFLIDDGTATLKLHQNILNPNIKSKKSLNTLIREYRYKIFGLQSSLKNEQINYFTFFELLPHQQEEIIQHHFSFIKKLFLNKPKESDNVIYLLGQNFIELGAVEEEIYIQYLKKIIHYYKNKKIIYYPHRAESINQKYKELNSRTFQIKESKQPIEIEFLINNIYPSHIASFTSSALFSLHQIFPKASIDSFIIKPEDLLTHKEIIQMLYDSQDRSINQINLI